MATKKTPPPPAFDLCGDTILIRPDFTLTLGETHLYQWRLANVSTDREFLDMMLDFLLDVAVDKDQVQASWKKLTDFDEVNAAVSAVFEAAADRPT